MKKIKVLYVLAVASLILLFTGCGNQNKLLEGTTWYGEREISLDSESEQISAENDMYGYSSTSPYYKVGYDYSIKLKLEFTTDEIVKVTGEYYSKDSYYDSDRDYVESGIINKSYYYLLEDGKMYFNTSDNDFSGYGLNEQGHGFGHDALYDGSKISVLAFYYANFGLPNELRRGRTSLLDFWEFSGIDPEYYDGDTYVENYELVSLQQQ